MKENNPINNTKNKDENIEKNEVNEKENGEMKVFDYKYVEKLRKECSRYRRALKKVKELYEGFSQEDLDEYNRLKETVEKQKIDSEKREKEQKLKKIDDLIIKIAKSSFAIVPKQIAALLRNEIEINDKGDALVINDKTMSVEDFVNGFLKDNLHLVRNKSNRKGASTAPSRANTFSIEQISNMTYEQYKRNRDRILKTLSTKV